MLTALRPPRNTPPVLTALPPRPPAPPRSTPPVLTALPPRPPSPPRSTPPVLTAVPLRRTFPVYSSAPAPLPGHILAQCKQLRLDIHSIMLSTFFSVLPVFLYTNLVRLLSEDFQKGSLFLL